jgi:hypothetical protein
MQVVLFQYQPVCQLYKHSWSLVAAVVVVLDLVEHVVISMVVVEQVD